MPPPKKHYNENHKILLSRNKKNTATGKRCIKRKP